MLRWSDSTTHHTRCRVCGFEGELAECVVAPHVLATEPDVQFVRCHQCDSISALRDILSFDHIQQGDIEIFLRQYVESTAGLWEMFWPVACLDGASGKSLLDVGCGFGFTADAWKTVVNDRAFGCDPAPYAAAGRRLLGDHISHALLDDVSALDGAQFDVVYSSEVIEHVPDPRAFAQLLKSRLADRGVLALTTPAADFVVPSSDPSTTSAALAAGFHGFLFSRAELERLLVSIGFAHVIVERHGERLIAWASDAPIERVAVESVAAPYAAYLATKVAQLAGASDGGQKSLRAGYAYRLFKDRYLRGQHADLAELRQILLADAVFEHDLTIETPGAVETAFANLPLGASAFGGVARYCFPQLALLFGFHAEHQERQADLAYTWYELALTSTQKLCGPTVLSGLEAAAFYWQALQRLIFLDTARGSHQQAATRFARFIEARIQPEPLIGGGAASNEACWQTLDAWLAPLTQRRDAGAIQLAADGLASVAPKHVTGEDALTFSAACNATAQLLRLYAAILAGNPVAARELLAQLSVSAPGADKHPMRRDWHAALQERLAAIRSHVPSATPPTFASGTSPYRWSTGGAGGKRFG